MSPQEKELAQRAQTYHHYELRRMRRAAEAKQLGLDVHEFAMPWPGNHVSHTHHHAGGWLKGALLSAALLGGGLGTGAWFASALLPNNGSDKATNKSNDPRERTNVWDYEIDLEVVPPHE